MVRRLSVKEIENIYADKMDKFFEWCATTHYSNYQPELEMRILEIIQQYKTMLKT